MNTQSEYAVDAFRAELDYVWGATKFALQVPEMCQARAIACSIKENPINLARSRRLLFHYLSECKKDRDDSLINIFYKQLPIDDAGISKYLSNVCTLYNKPPQRSHGEKGSEDKLFVPVYEAFTVDLYYQMAHEWTRSGGIIAMRPVIRLNELTFDILTRDLFNVVTHPDDPHKAIEVWYPETVNGELQLVKMTDRVIEYRRRDDPEKLIKSIPNDWGEIQFVFVRRRIEEDFYGGGDFKLVEQRMEANSQRWYANLSSKFDSHGIIIATNTAEHDEDEEDEDGDIRITPGTIISRNGISNGGADDEAPPDVKIINGSGQYNEVDSLRKGRIHEGLRSRGVPQSNLDENPGVAPSGEARKAERAELDSAREKDVAYLTKMEKAMKRKIALAINDAPVMIDGKLVKNLPVNDKLTLQFRREPVLMAPKDQLEHMTALVDEDIISIAAIINEFGSEGQVDDTKAIEIIRRNRETRKRAEVDSDEEFDAKKNQPPPPSLIVPVQQDQGALEGEKLAEQKANEQQQPPIQ